ncbi:putative outer membrane protein [Acetobacter sp. CAG:977]|nr:putative outer membrane protein [Acetobacter sp. CAG:977]
MLRKLCVASLIAVTAIPAVSQASVLGLMTKKDVDKAIEEYLDQNPQVVVEAFQKYQVMQEAEKQAAIARELAVIRSALENDPTSPIIGNPNGDVTVVEFFDYQCGFCKRMFSKVLKSVNADGNIRWVLRDLPTLGPISRTAAKASLAANKQGKFFEFHQAMMTNNDRLEDEDDVMDVAKKAGLDVKQLKQDMESPEIEKILNDNAQLALKVQTQGVPNFIIGDYISHGAMMGNELEENVAKVRANAKK